MRDHGEQQWKDILSFYESRGWPSPSETSQVLEYLETQQFHDARHLFDPHSYPDVTCWTHRPLFRIDHCLVSDTFKDKFSVVSFDTPSTSASDHYPIVVDFRLAKT